MKQSQASHIYQTFFCLVGRYIDTPHLLMLLFRHNGKCALRGTPLVVLHQFVRLKLLILLSMVQQWSHAAIAACSF